MKSNIALIGFMAVGKSAVGKLLAEKTGKAFVEVDSLIEQKAGKPVSRIFKEEGEIVFREYEIELIKEVSKQKNLVLACGGGIVLNTINIDRLKQESVLIWLTASVPSILERLKTTGDTRPLITGKDRENQVRSLFNYRQPFYERAAEMQVDTSDLTVKQVADYIMAKLKINADYR
jgi:shikimate kinase